MVVYGGDDVSALVLDIGSHTVRAGYAGDDSPKVIFPSSYGYRDDMVPSASEGGQPTQTRRVWVGDYGPAVWRPGQEVGSPFHEGTLVDFTHVPNLIGHAFKESLRCDPADHPVLATEPAWNTPANRERMAEILFEEFKVPAFYIANSGVLTAFAAGRGTALIVDVGNHDTSVVPVVDGFVLRKGIQRSSLSLLRHLSVGQVFAKKNVQIIPHQLIASKMPVGVDAPPQMVLREDRRAQTTQSWSEWAHAREADEWLAAVGGVYDSGYSSQQQVPRPGKQYEFPTGYTTIFHNERYLPGEIYFQQDAFGNQPNLPPTLPTLLHASIGACEPDLKAQLLANTVLTGGGSLLVGFPERLNNELNKLWPGKAKLTAAGNGIERQYGAWIGGSILASLGTFHQLWISRAEYQEHGKSIVSQRKIRRAMPSAACGEEGLSEALPFSTSSMSAKSQLNIVFGAMTFGDAETESARTHSVEDISAILDTFQSHGHKEVDTARAYTNGTSERLLGDVGWQERGLIVETKLYPRVNERHTPEDLRKTLDTSLAALRTDKVELFYLHAPDRTVPWEITFKAVDDLYKEGKFDKLGISNYMAFEVAEIVTLCRIRGWIQPTVYQGIYNVIHRAVEPELFPCLRKFGIAFYAYNPLSGGFLTGRYVDASSKPEPGTRFDDSKGTSQSINYRKRYWNEHNFKALSIIADAAKKENLTIAEVALRWMSHHSLMKREHNDSVIIGASKREHLSQNLIDLEKGPLPQSIVAAADEAWRIVAPYVHKYWH